VSTLRHRRVTLNVVTHQPRELRYWCDQVGPEANKVREHLFGGFSSGGPTC